MKANAPELDFINASASTITAISAFARAHSQRGTDNGIGAGVASKTTSRERYSASTIASEGFLSLGISVDESSPCFFQPSRRSQVLGSHTGSGS